MTKAHSKVSKRSIYNMLEAREGNRNEGEGETRKRKKMNETMAVIGLMEE